MDVSASQLRSPLIGRDRELGLLRPILAAALTGRGSLVLISGEAGVGKTALATALCREAADAGALVLVGRNYDRAEAPPFGPWIEIITRANRAVPPGSATPDPAPAPGLETSFAQTRERLAALSQERPLVLLLEDLHWADPASLDLLRALARELTSAPLLLLATYRDEEVHRRHPLHTLLPLLIRESAAARLDLRSLDSAAAHDLVRARYALADDETARLGAYLMARTEGNALFITELLRTLEEEGLLRREGGHWHVGAIIDAPVPQLLKQIINSRLARLGDDVAALLAVAAVIGQEVPLAMWGTVARADEIALLGAAERAETANLIAAWSDGAGIRFTHALIREALYEGIPTLRRRRLHRQAGDAAAALRTPDPDAVAHHFMQALDERAAVWLILAGERAEEAAALVTAADRYEAAFGVLDARQQDAADRGWLRLLAASLRHNEFPDRARIWVDQAVLLAEQAGDASLTARARALRGLLRSYGGDVRGGIADLDAATASAEGLPSGVGIARRGARRIDMTANRGTLVALLAYVGHLAEARAQGERYLASTPAAASTPAERGALADVQTGLAVVYALQGEPERARRAYAACIAAYEAIGHHQHALLNRSEDLVMCVLPYQADDLPGRERVAAAAERAAAWMLERGGRVNTDILGYVRVPLLMVEGRWHEARQILEPPDSSAVTTSMYFREFYRGTLAREQGDQETAWQCVRAAWPEGPAPASGEWLVSLALRLQALAAALALDAGDFAAARAWLDAHRQWLTWMGATLGRAEAHMLEAEWCRAAGDEDGARGHAEQALAHATTPRQPLALLAAHRLLGMLEAEAGQAETAERHLADALALADACAAPYERALTLLALAPLQTERNEHARARQLLEEAREALLPLDARPALARAELVAARLTRAAERPPAGLSAREIEVLRLVAQGLSNAAIAERLFLSPGTVKAHLVRIFAKLGVTNRAAATQFALRRGLA